MSESAKKKINFIINVVYAAVIAGLLYIAFRFAGLVIPFIIAITLVSLFQPLARFIHRKFHISQKVISVMAMALLYIAIGGLIFFLVTRLVFLLQNVFTVFPDYYQETVVPVLNNLTNSISKWFTIIPASWTAGIDNLPASLIDGLQNIVLSVSQKGVTAITGFINRIPSFFVSLIFTIMLSFFISLQYNDVTAFLLTQVPQKTADTIFNIKSILKNTIFKYIKAYLILMMFTFIELTFGFLVLGISNAMVTAAGIAVFDALPIFGTGGIMIPWILIELVQGNYSRVMGLAILYGIVTVIRNIIEPKVVGDQLGINPVVSLMSIYIGYRILGVIGMIVFPMLAQILLVLHEKGSIELYKEKKKTEENS